MRYRVEHKKIKFVSTSGHPIFCLLYKLTNDDVFDDFPKMSENVRRLTNISEEESIVFRSYSNKSKGFVAVALMYFIFRR